MGAARVGKTLGNFRILECLGSGGSGMIWKAEDLSLGRIVALKALRAELATNTEMAQRFRDEARTLARLSHANVASLYSLIEDDDGLFLVLEYVEGNTLAALLATSGPLPLDTAFALFHQVLDGVGHAHEAGVVHRDLKPANLMVDARGRVKVMDFGIARVTGAARTTHHGKLVGTPEYMSPEQVRGEDATIRSDVYSLGIVLFEMVCGRPPFRAAASFELMRAQVEEAPPDPHSLRPELDARVAAAILRALAKRPADRFAGVRELQDALLDAGAARRGHAVAPVWRELPAGAAAAASEAPTLASLSRPGPATEAAHPAGEPRGSAEPQSATRPTEPQDAWERAVDALDDDLGASRTRRPAQPAARAQAHATVVLDVGDDTVHLTREGAADPLAGPSLPSADRPDPPRIAPARVALWGALAATLLALAFGVVRLRETASTSPGAALPSAPEPMRSQTAAPTAPAPRVSTPAPAADAPASRAPEAPRSERPARAAHRRAAPPAEPTEPAPAPAPQPAEDSGWVIRR